MNIKSIALFAAGIFTAASVMAKPSVTKATAKVADGNLNVAYTLSEKGYDPDESCRFVEVLLFESQSDATSWFNAAYNDGESEAEPFTYLDVEDIENGSYKLSYSIEDYIGLTVREMKAEYPNAVVAIVAGEECEAEGYTLATARVDYSSASSVSALALRLYKKSQTLNGVCESDGAFCGTVALKLGAINKKNGTVKVSATYTPFSGKKVTASHTVEADEEGYLSGVLKFKGYDDEFYYSVWPNEEDEEAESLTFSLEDEGGCYYMYMAQVGGTLEADVMSFYQDMEEELELDEDYEWLDIFPDDAEITVVKGTKWTFAKSPTIKYKKFREDGEVWYDLVGLDDDSKPNVSGLKLTYTAKTGAFKGSYYLYASNACCIDPERAPKLKKYKVTVSGVVIDGIGYGSASVKIGKESKSWSVFVE